MKNTLLFLALIAAIGFAGCSKHNVATVTPTSGSGRGSGLPGQGGVITAGEWNDLNNWAFWASISDKNEFAGKADYWKFFNSARIAVTVSGTDTLPVIDAVVALKRNGTVIFTARTDNTGRAELWVDLFQNPGTIDYAQLSIDVANGAFVATNVKPFSDGVNEIVMAPAASSKGVEIAFVVDATGSMGDELEYLKRELLNVINRAKTTNPNAAISTGAVFYRDEGDAYVTRQSDFTTDINITLKYIKDQSAGGGGDFPEAVHTALDKAVNQLQWSANARARLLFLILDAPPHHTTGVISSLQTTIAAAAAMGIKIIPVTASGIDKETEYLMRCMAMSTNGTYIFITDDSGVGNDHLEGTVGQYDVEYLNDMMVRLISKYAR